MAEALGCRVTQGFGDTKITAPPHATPEEIEDFLLNLQLGHDYETDTCLEDKRWVKEVVQQFWPLCCAKTELNKKTVFHYIAHRAESLYQATNCARYAYRYWFVSRKN